MRSASGPIRASSGRTCFAARWHGTTTATRGAPAGAGSGTGTVRKPIGAAGAVIVAASLGADTAGALDGAAVPALERPVDRPDPGHVGGEVVGRFDQRP